MSLYSDFISGGGLPVIPFAEFSDHEIEFSKENAVSMGVGDKTCMTFSSTSSLRMYDDSGSLVWTVSISDFDLTGFNCTHYMGMGHYIPSEGIIHLIVGDSATDDVLYASIDSLTGVVTIPKQTTHATISSTFDVNTDYYIDRWVYSLNGNTFVALSQESKFTVDITTGDITEIAGNNIPRDQLIPSNITTELISFYQSHISDGRIYYFCSRPTNVSPTASYNYLSQWGDYMYISGNAISNNTNFLAISLVEINDAIDAALASAKSEFTVYRGE